MSDMTAQLKSITAERKRLDARITALGTKAIALRKELAAAQARREQIDAALEPLRQLAGQSPPPPMNTTAQRSPAARADGPSVKQRLHDALGTHGTMSLAELEGATGIASGTIEASMSALCKDGLVERPMARKWRLRRPSETITT